MGPIKSEIKMFVMRDARVFAEGYRNINEYKLMIFTFDLPPLWKFESYLTGRLIDPVWLFRNSVNCDQQCVGLFSTFFFKFTGETV